MDKSFETILFTKQITRKNLKKPTERVMVKYMLSKHDGIVCPG